MRKKELLSLLQQVEVFPNPKLHLEQYITGPIVAADVLYTAAVNFDDICNKTVLDLGCGTGMLSVGALAMGAGYVLGMDIDPDALAIAQDNMESLLDDVNYDLLQFDVLRCRGIRAVFDAVIMNPPFGTKGTEGIDMVFLDFALATADTVYSLHKSSTRQHILRTTKSKNVKAEVVGQFRYDLPATYKFHKKRSFDIEVDLYRFNKTCR